MCCKIRLQAVNCGNYVNKVFSDTMDKISFVSSGGSEKSRFSA